MSIIRAPRPESNFYLLDKQIIEDQRLSWAARGLLVYLLGKPDHWKVSVAHLRNETASSDKPTGRDGVYSLLDELIKAGYMLREQGRKDGGKLGETNYIVSERPLPAQPDTAQPLPAQPDTANPTLVSIEDKQVSKEANTEGRKERSAKFDPMSAKPSGVTEAVWSEWCKFRKEIRKPLTETMCRQQAKALDAVPNADAVILKSIANGWTGLFPEKSAAKPKGRHDLQGRDYGSDITIGGL